MALARAWAVSGALGLAAACAYAVGCGGDDASPDCTLPEAGCGVMDLDSSSPVDSSMADVAVDSNTSTTPDAGVSDTGARDSGAVDAQDASVGEDAHDSGHDARG